MYDIRRVLLYVVQLIDEIEGETRFFTSLTSDITIIVGMLGMSEV